MYTIDAGDTEALVYTIGAGNIALSTTSVLTATTLVYTIVAGNTVAYGTSPTPHCFSNNCLNYIYSKK